MKSFVILMSLFIVLWLLLFPRLNFPDPKSLFYKAVHGGISPCLQRLRKCLARAFSPQEPDTPVLHTPALPDGEEPVVFASEDFALLLRIAMGKQPGEPVFPRELAAVRSLTLSPHNAELSAHAIDLSHSSGSDVFNYLSDWSSALEPSWHEEVLTGFSLTDLRHFPALEHLSIVSVGVRDLDALAALPLTSLALTLCSLTDADCAPLCALTSLTSLDLAFNDLEDVSFLSSLTALENLSLTFNPVLSAEPLRPLTRMRNLDLASTNIASLEPLCGMQELVYLDLTFAGDPQALSLAPVENLPKLRALDAVLVQANGSVCSVRIDCVTGVTQKRDHH